MTRLALGRGPVRGRAFAIGKGDKCGGAEIGRGMLEEPDTRRAAGREEKREAAEGGQATTVEYVCARLPSYSHNRPPTAGLFPTPLPLLVPRASW